MSKTLKFLKLNFKRDKAIFFGGALINLVVIALLLITGFIIRTIIIRSGEIDYGAMEKVFFLGANSAIPIVIFVTIAINIYRKIYNTDGSMFNIVQLPIDKNWQIASIYVESLVFALVNILIVVLVYRLLRNTDIHSRDIMVDLQGLLGNAKFNMVAPIIFWTINTGYILLITMWVKLSKKSLLIAGAVIFVLNCILKNIMILSIMYINAIFDSSCARYPMTIPIIAIALIIINRYLYKTRIDY